MRRPSGTCTTPVRTICAGSRPTEVASPRSGPSRRRPGRGAASACRRSCAAAWSCRRRCCRGRRRPCRRAPPWTLRARPGRHRRRSRAANRCSARTALPLCVVLRRGGERASGNGEHGHEVGGSAPAIRLRGPVARTRGAEDDPAPNGRDLPVGASPRSAGRSGSDLSRDVAHMGRDSKGIKAATEPRQVTDRSPCRLRSRRADGLLTLSRRRGARPHRSWVHLRAWATLRKGPCPSGVVPEDPALPGRMGARPRGRRKFPRETVTRR